MAEQLPRRASFENELPAMIDADTHEAALSMPCGTIRLRLSCIIAVIRDIVLRMLTAGAKDISVINGYACRSPRCPSDVWVMGNLDPVGHAYSGC